MTEEIRYGTYTQKITLKNGEVKNYERKFKLSQKPVGRPKNMKTKLIEKIKSADDAVILEIFNTYFSN